MDVTGLFPTPVARVEKCLDQDLIGELTQDIARNFVIANKKSEQLSHTQIIKPEASTSFAKANILIRPKLEEFGAHLFGETLDWSIKELWANVLEKGGQQSLHNHANSFISGVIYLTQPHPSTHLIFHKAIGTPNFVFSNQHQTTKFGPYNGGKWMIPKLSPGDLVLFPSYLLHEVPINHGERRITLAFNAIPKRLDSFGYAINFS